MGSFSSDCGGSCGLPEPQGRDAAGGETDRASFRASTPVAGTDPCQTLDGSRTSSGHAG